MLNVTGFGRNVIRGVVFLALASLVLGIAGACGGEDVEVTREVIKEVPVTQIVREEVVVTKEVVVKEEVVVTKIVEVVATSPPTAAMERPSAWKVVIAEQTAEGGPFTEYGSNTQYYLQEHIMEPLVNIQLLDDETAWGSVPILASSWELLDVQTLVIKVDTSIKFHNGETLTPEHVKFSYDSIIGADPSIRRVFLLRPLGEATIIDEDTIRWDMPKPFVSINRSLGSIIVPALARKTTDPKEFARAPIGTGPYKSVEYTRDKPVKLEAWSDYRLGEPFPKQLTVQYIPEPFTRLAALQTGAAHIAQKVPIDALESIENNPKLEVVSIKGGTGMSYVMNVFKPPLRDPRVRQAMNYAIDRELIVEAVLEGLGIPMPSPLWPGWLGYDPAVQPYPYDPEKAKALLKEAGFENGFSFEWTIAGTFQKSNEIAEAVSNQLKQVGIDVTIRRLERARLLANRNKGEYDVLELIWPVSWDPTSIFRFTLFNPYPVDILEPLYGPTPAGLTKARSLYAKATSAPQLADQEATYGELSEHMRDESFWLFVHVVDEVWGVQKSIKWRPYPGVFLGDNRWYDYWDLIGKQAPDNPTMELVPKK